MTLNNYFYCCVGIVKRETSRFFQQRSRLFSALVRPLLWLIVFAAGFRAALGVSIMEPYGTYITYQEYIIPGLCCMIVLFNGMQSSLSMVYDREMGSMKVLLMSPLPMPFLLSCKLIAIAFLSLMQVYVFLLCAQLVDVDISLLGYLTAVPAVFLIAFFLGASIGGADKSAPVLLAFFEASLCVFVFFLGAPVGSRPISFDLGLLGSAPVGSRPISLLLLKTPLALSALIFAKPLAT